jgi:hypothetical protein
MYEPATGKIVLIDFEKAKDLRAAGSEGLRRDHETDLENLEYARLSLRAMVTGEFEDYTAADFDSEASIGSDDEMW